MGTENAITGSEFAELTGMSRSAISTAVNRGKLKDARVPSGRIDVDHPAAIAYIARAAKLRAKYEAGQKKRGRGSPTAKPPAPRGKYKKKEPAPSVDTPPSEDVAKVLNGLPPDIRELADWSLRRLIEQFGHSTAMEDYLKSLRIMEKIHAERLKNAREEGTVVSRDLVQRGVLEPFDLCFQRLLADGARTIATRVADMARAGESNESCEAFVSERLTDFIKGTKATAGRALEPGGGG